MHPFPSTASLPVNHEYDAAIDVLHRHRLDCCVDEAGFTLPASAIQGAARISGSAVRQLLRSNASNAIVHPDDLRPPWMEIIGVYTFRSEAGSCAVMAIYISPQPLIEKALLMDASDGTFCVNSEKTRLLDKSSELLGKFLSASADMLEKLSLENPEMSAFYQGNAMSRLMQLAVTRPEFIDGDVDKVSPGGMIFVCDRLEPDSLRELLHRPDLPVLRVRSLPEFMVGRLMVWRSIFGTGWLNVLDNFLNSLESALRCKQWQDYVQVSHAASTRMAPAGLAAVAAAKLVTHGWLPQQYSSISHPASGLSVIKRFVETCGGAMTDGDVSVFELPRFVFPGEHDLQLGTPEARMMSTWGLFQTPYAEDDVFMFFDHSGYGEREVDVLDFHGPDPSQRKLMPLGFLCPISLGVLRCLLPAMRIDIIGYAPAASTTTRSAVIERRLRLLSLQPSNPDYLGSLREVVSELRKPSEMKQPKCSTHTQCMELDGLIQAHETTNAPACPSSADALPESWPKKLIRILLSAGRGSEDSEVFPTILMLSSLLLQVPAKQLKPLLLAGKQSPAREVDLVIAIYKLISLASSGDPDIRRTRGSTFNHLALRKQIVIMIRDAVKGRLAVPVLLADWITKHVRITCVMALDPMCSGLLPTPVPGRPALAGSFQSHRLYKKLFSPEAVKASIEVDLTPLVDHALCALATAKGKSPGWLANKISQSNELVVNMMVKTGHLEDFPYGEMLSAKTPKNGKSMLAVLPAQLLVRCIVNQIGGRELLANWAGDLGGRVAAHWRKDLAGTSEQSPLLSSASATILEVFGDAEGIAAAALDCYRGWLLAAGGAKPGDIKLSVHFLPEELRNQFRIRRLTGSLGVRACSESLGSEDDDVE